jgi:hypothetical protein
MIKPSNKVTGLLSLPSNILSKKRLDDKTIKYVVEKEIR